MFSSISNMEKFAGISYIMNRVVINVGGRNMKTSIIKPFRSNISLLILLIFGWFQYSLQAAVLEEIIVTAQKREQSLQEVPLAVSAFTGDFLDNGQIFSADDLSQILPTVSILGAATANNKVLRVRGIGTQSFGAAVEPSVSMVIDGVVLARQSQGFQDLLDVERIEVLRGPQSTLFGKNASAGVIHFISKNPSEEFEATGEVTVAEQDEYRFRGSVSGPLSDSAGFRLTGYYRDIGGYYENAFDGSETNAQEHWGLRGKFEFQPTDRLNILLSADYNKEDDECCQPAVAQTFGPTAAEYLSVVAPAEVSENSTSININSPLFNNTEDWGVSAQIDYDLEWARLTSITAYREWEIGFNSDVDTKPFLTSTPSLFFEISFDRFSSFRDLEQFSQELRLASPSGQTFEWVVGAFYWSMDMDVRRENRFGNCGKFIPPNVVSTIQPCPAPFYTSGFFDGTIENDNAAVFGQINWHLTDRFELFGGVRAVYENLESRTLRPVAPLPEFPGDGVDSFNVTLPLVTDTDNDEYALTGRVGLSFDMADNARLFVSYARGFKGASVNVDNVSSNDTVDPEFVDSVEGGIKAELFDNRLHLSIIGFWAEYEDFQSQSIDPTGQSAAFFLSNAGVVTTEGMELEFVATPVEGLTLSGGVAYTDAVFDEFSGATCYIGQTAAQGCIGGVQDLAGKDIPNSPDWKYTIVGRYEFPISDSGYQGFVQGSYVWQDDVVMREDNNPKTMQDSYGIFDLSAGVSSPNDRYSASIFVKNVGDKNFGTNRIDFAFTGVGAPVVQFRPKNADTYVGGTLRVNY